MLLEDLGSEVLNRRAILASLNLEKALWVNLAEGNIIYVRVHVVIIIYIHTYRSDWR